MLFQLEQLTKLMSPTGDFGEYHRDVKALKPPYVPYLGAELQAFASIDQSNPNVIEKEKDVLLNFEKGRRMLDALKRLFIFKSKPMSFSNSQKGAWGGGVTLLPCSVFIFPLIVKSSIFHVQCSHLVRVQMLLHSSQQQRAGS